jgi:hypothetical protein
MDLFSDKITYYKRIEPWRQIIKLKGKAFPKSKL